MNITEILDYVMQTPENTNRAVLKSMLEQLNVNSDNNDEDSITLSLIKATIGDEMPEDHDS